MPTRAELDALKDQLKAAIQAETSQVQAEIQSLRDKLAGGAQITDDDLKDIQAAIGEVEQIDPDVTPPP